MYSEANRRETFTSWPHVGYRWAQPDPMAQAGFYHQVKGFVIRSICFLSDGLGRKKVIYFFSLMDFQNNSEGIMKKMSFGSFFLTVPYFHALRLLLSCTDHGKHCSNLSI